MAATVTRRKDRRNLRILALQKSGASRTPPPRNTI